MTDISFKLITALFCFSFLLSINVSADAVVAAQESSSEIESINSVLEQANDISKDFSEKTFQARSGRYFFGRLLPGHVSSLSAQCTYSKTNIENLDRQIVMICDKIETYPGQDWEHKYGSTSIWRRANQVRMLVCYLDYEIQYWAALCKDDASYISSLCALCRQLDALDKECQAPALKLVKLRIYCSLIDSDQRFKGKALQIAEEIMKLAAEDDIVYFQTNLELALYGLLDSNRFSSVYKSFMQSSFADNADLNFLFACVHAKYGCFDPICQALARWPQLRPLAAEFILEHYSHDQEIFNASSTAASLAALGAIHLPDKLNDKLLKGLIDLNSGTASADYLEYLRIQKQSPDDYKSQIKSLMECAIAKKRFAWEDEEICSARIAHLAMQKLYDWICQDSSACESADGCIDLYVGLANGNLDQHLVYLTAVEMNKTNPPQAQRIFRMILAAKSQYSKRAQLDLYIIEFERILNKNPQELGLLISKIENYLKTLDESDTLYSDAVAFYSQIVLELEDAQKIKSAIEYFDGISISSNPYLPSLKAELFFRSGNMIQALDVLNSNFGDDFTDDLETRLYILYNALSRIEQYQAQFGDQAFLDACRILAGQCRRIETQNTLVDVLDMEVNILCGKDVKIDNESINLFSQSHEGARMLARKYMLEKEYEFASKYWAKASRLCGSPSGDSDTQFGWARARYYQLYASYLSAAYTDQQLIHALEVLQKQITDDKLLWYEKISSLKNSLIN